MTRRLLLCAALALGLLVPATASAAKGRPFGLGIQLGEPTGLSAKLYLDQPFALQMGLGFVDDFDNEDGLYAHLDFIWHPAIITRQPAFTMPFYFGVGGRFLRHHYNFRLDRNDYVDSDTHFGVRVPIGILMDFNRVPIDVFFELALVIDLIRFDEDYYGDVYHYHHDRVGLDGGIGIRYYF